MGGRRIATSVVGLATAIIVAGCSYRPVDRAGDRLEAANSRVREARLEGDPAVAARLDEIRADLAREPTPVLDEFQIRVDNSNDGEHDVGVTARIPVPNPFEIRSDRNVRRSATSISEARLDETILVRRAEECFRIVEGADHRLRADLYEAYEAQQLELLEWNRRGRKSGSVNEQVAIRFEIERRVTLAKRIPRPPSSSFDGESQLPGVRAPEARLVKDPDYVRAIVHRAHPSVAVQSAESARYAALSIRAKRRDYPWLDFVDLVYDAREGRSDEISGQIALRIPLGRTGRNQDRHFRALRESRKRDAESITLEYARQAQFALEEIDHFESNAARWRLLLDLAVDASEAAERWKRDRLGTLSQVARLLDEAHEARTTVLTARARAGMAACRLLVSSSVDVADWKRESLADPAPIEFR